METYVLPIHFDNFQEKHQINSDSLLIFIESYKEISEIFGINTEIQISVPEEGGWKTNLLFIVTFVGFSPMVALLTGESADDWGKIGHAKIIQKINKFIVQQTSEIPEDYPKECIKQKNRIYQQFIKDECIDTFHLDNYLPIPRNNFHLYIKKIPDEESVYLGEAEITVHSPDWKGKRSWRGNIDNVDDKESAFDFDKDLTGKFWEKIKLDALPLHTTDVMRVQLVKRPSSKVKYLVIRVISYNGEDIDSPISENNIRKFAIFDIQTSKSISANQSEFQF